MSPDRRDRRGSNGSHEARPVPPTFGSALARIAGELAHASTLVEEWGRNHAPSPSARNTAELAAMDLAGSAALVRRAGSELAAMELAEELDR